MNQSMEDKMSGSENHSYDEIRDRARAAKVCPYKHSCGRYDHVMSEWYSGTPNHKYEVWDNHGQNDEEGEMVFSSDSEAECLTYLERHGTELRENGKCDVCDMYEKRKAAVAQGKQPSFLIVAWGTSRAYGGPEEGGWWYDIDTVLEVRRAFTFEEGLRHARELREEYPQPRYNRFSCANRGEDDVYIRCVYAENDPRMPEDSPRGKPVYQ